MYESVNIDWEYSVPCQNPVSLLKAATQMNGSVMFVLLGFFQYKLEACLTLQMRLSHLFQTANTHTLLTGQIVSTI